MSIDRSFISSQFDKALALHQAGQLSPARKLYEEILSLHPNHSDSLHLLGVLNKQSGFLTTAISLMLKALEIEPKQPFFHSNIGNAYREVGDLQKSEFHLSYSLHLKPDYPEAHNNLGLTYHEQTKYELGLEHFEKAITQRPAYANAFYNRGNTLKLLRRLEHAIQSYEAALAIEPRYAKALNNKGAAQLELRHWREAQVSFKEALKINPNYPEAFHNLGLAQVECKQFSDAIESFESALAISPDYPYLLGTILHTRMKICDWHDHDALFDKVLNGVNNELPVINAFPFLALVDAPDMHRKVARIWIQDNCHKNSIKITTSSDSKVDLPVSHQSQHQSFSKIKIGYFSADFHNHATAYLMAELFEHHDRTRFEIIAFSFGPNKNDEMRKRLSRSFDQFYDVSRLSDLEISNFSRSLSIDIAIDLKGLTQDQRINIFANRVAPIQVSFIGYPGTIGAPFIDYLIADQYVITPESEIFFDEKIIYLPNSYQVNDTKRIISESVPSRHDLGIPDNSFVFCCFNNNYKITPSMFDVWVKIMRNVPESVLWLLEDNQEAAANLKKEASNRGLDPSRLIFAKRAPLSEHLARHKQADLFLDTFPYNAHTTASDALWAGVPVLTCSGLSFASRVGASLLNAVGLNELVTHNFNDYELLATDLATDSINCANKKNHSRSKCHSQIESQNDKEMQVTSEVNSSKLSKMKISLTSNKLALPLFDSKRFTLDLEHVYHSMYENISLIHFNNN